MPDPAGPRASALAVSRGTWLSLLVLVAVPFFFYAVDGPGREGAAGARHRSLPAVLHLGNAGAAGDRSGARLVSRTSSRGCPRTAATPTRRAAPSTRWPGCSGLRGQNRGVWYWLLFSLAGLAVFAFLRRQGFSRPASATAALLFSMTPYFLGNVARRALHEARGALPPPGVPARARHAPRAPGPGARRVPGGRGRRLARLGEPPAGGLLRPARRRLYAVCRAPPREAAPPGAAYWIRLAGFGLAAAALASPAWRPSRTWPCGSTPPGRSAAAVPRGGAGRRRRRLGLRDRLVVPPAGAGGLSLPGMVRAAGADLLGADAVHAVDALLRRGRGGPGGRRPRAGRAGRAGGSGAASRSSCSSSASAASCRSSIGPMFHLVPFFNRFRRAVDDLQHAAALPRLPGGRGAGRAAGGARRAPRDPAAAGGEAKRKGRLPPPPGRPPGDACSGWPRRWSFSGSCWPSVRAGRSRGQTRSCARKRWGVSSPAQVQALQGERLAMLQQSWPRA